MPQNNAAPGATTNGHHSTLADRLRRGVLPLPAPRPLNPATQILDLTKEVHAYYRSASGPASSLSTSSDGAK